MSIYAFHEWHTYNRIKSTTAKFEYIQSLKRTLHKVNHAILLYIWFNEQNVLSHVFRDYRAHGTRGFSADIIFSHFT